MTDEHIVEVQPCDSADRDGEWMWDCFTCAATADGFTFDDAEHDAQRHRDGR